MKAAHGLEYTFRLYFQSWLDPHIYLLWPSARTQASIYVQHWNSECCVTFSWSLTSYAHTVKTELYSLLQVQYFKPPFGRKICIQVHSDQLSQNSSSFKGVQLQIVSVFYSFGQMILFPWSHSSVPNPDHFKHLSASKAMAEGIKVLNNVTYAVGSVGNLLCK